MPECEKNNAVLYGKIYITTAQFTAKAHGQFNFIFILQMRPLRMFFHQDPSRALFLVFPFGTADPTFAHAKELFKR